MYAKGELNKIFGKWCADTPSYAFVTLKNARASVADVFGTER